VLCIPAALEDMDLVISPALCEVTVNPVGPQVARGWTLGAGGPRKRWKTADLKAPVGPVSSNP